MGRPEEIEQALMVTMVTQLTVTVAPVVATAGLEREREENGIIMFRIIIMAPEGRMGMVEAALTGPTDHISRQRTECILYNNMKTVSQQQFQGQC